MNPIGAHLVGSVPLADAETVFRTVAAALGRHLDRIPDGETGVRKDWIAWQYPVLAATKGLEPMPAGDRVYLRRQLVRLSGGRREAPAFEALGYADAALASYRIFARLKREGVIPQPVRFQVSLPTPLAPAVTFVTDGDRAVVEPAYERAMMNELDRIIGGIPHPELAVQWDTAAEFGFLEGLWPSHFGDVEPGIVTRLERLGRAVPRGIALGYHLCYGDFGHRHFVSPPDAGKLVRLANALSALARPLAWLHMPVPVQWTEPAAFAPLKELKLQPATRLFLGVVHAADGADGAQRRIARAAELAPQFGVATECGWGRRPPEQVPQLLSLLAMLAAPVR
jgi:hypothetical protein